VLPIGVAGVRHRSGPRASTPSGNGNVMTLEGRAPPALAVPVPSPAPTGDTVRDPPGACGVNPFANGVAAAAAADAAACAVAAPFITMSAASLDAAPAGDEPPTVSACSTLWARVALAASIAMPPVSGDEVRDAPADDPAPSNPGDAPEPPPDEAATPAAPPAAEAAALATGVPPPPPVAAAAAATAAAALAASGYMQSATKSTSSERLRICSGAGDDAGGDSAEEDVHDAARRSGADFGAADDSDAALGALRTAADNDGTEGETEASSAGEGLLRLVAAPEEDVAAMALPAIADASTATAALASGEGTFPPRR